MSPTSEFVQISPSEYPDFGTILESRLPKSAQFFNIFQTRLKRDLTEVTTFFSYNGLPPHRTCLLSQIHMPTKTFWTILAPICSKVEEVKDVMSVFRVIVDPTKGASFNALDESLLDHFLPPQWTPPGSVQTEFKGSVYTMPREVALHLDLGTPPGLIIQKLRDKDLPTVFTYWTYANGEPEELRLIRWAAAEVGSVGLFIDGHLISWGVAMRDGAIHAVHTLEEYRGRGLGRIVVRQLCRWVAEELNHIPVVQIEDNNRPSLALMTSLGFEVSHKIVWTEYHPPSSSNLL